jgi:ribonuclease HI
VKKVIIHSDGACDGNPGPGGWAAVLQYGERRREIAGSAMATTNNRMELQAAIEALKALKEPCEVALHTDSEYLRDGITGWIQKWKQKGWKTKDRQPVKNQSLWKELDALASKHQVSWHWVKGHAGNVHNERCDRLATGEIKKLRARHKPEEFVRALAEFKLAPTQPNSRDAQDSFGGGLTSRISAFGGSDRGGNLHPGPLPSDGRGGTPSRDVRPDPLRSDGRGGTAFLSCSLLFLFGFMLMTVRAVADDALLGLKLSIEKPEVFERVEITVQGVPSGTNPFDPESIAVDLEAVGPSGKSLHVPGFFLRDYERKLEGDKETVTARGEPGWRVWWLATEPGRHTLTVAARLGGKVVGQGHVSVEAVAGKRHGFARVEPEARRNFRLDDGTPLFLNGLCCCWHGRRGTYDYDDWLEAFQKAGINYIRIWMWPLAFSIEWDKGDRTQYRLDNAWKLDQVLAEAERRGIFVMLCLDYHGMFEVKPDYWGGNNYWSHHPYAATNGGPCAIQNDFFTNSEAKQLYGKRLRYIVARWGAFPNILAWEFFNEIDNEYAYLKHADVVAWHGEMGRRLRALDPYRHLITSSFTGGSERPDLFALPEMDFAQYHSYNEKHPARMMAEKTARFFEKYHKPFFVSEYGTDWKGWKPDTDPHLRALHQAIWSGAFTGAAGTGMTWWWEHIHSANLYPHWSALSAFLEGTRLGRPELRPARFENNGDAVLPFGVASRDAGLVWLLDRACDWPDGAMVAEPERVTGAKVTLTGVADGAWSITWWDTLSGKQMASGQATASGSKLVLEPPAFQADIAARLNRIGGAKNRE